MVVGLMNILTLKVYLLFFRRNVRCQHHSLFTLGNTGQLSFNIGRKIITDDLCRGFLELFFQLARCFVGTDGYMDACIDITGIHGLYHLHQTDARFLVTGPHGPMHRSSAAIAR